ncbi:MAG: sugar phosphate isomerase/epimerase [Ruminococcaceae bacterium]|nr:sugar phosphate isomerase/epimerase [Oscillospiraceae bacterium]
MKLGVMTPVLYDMDFASAVRYLHSLGVQTVEVGAGGCPGKTHLDPDKLLGDDAAIQAIIDVLKENDMTICALSCHDNAVHPNKEYAARSHADFEKTVLLAEKLGVTTVITFSGCPGDSENSLYPNWVTCAWPPDYLTILDYQWNEVLIPYWKKAAAFAEAHGIKKIALELHPGFCCYNPETLLRLREAVGPIIGANLDPSHLFWQGIDIPTAIRKLGPAIHHFHAKDTKIDPANASADGVLDTKHYDQELKRSWIFRTVGYGHDAQTWKDIISNLRMVGYDGPISIEHEDSLMSPREGLCKAIEFLKEVLIFESKGEMWWA